MMIAPRSSVMIPEASTHPHGEELRICIARKILATPAKIRKTPRTSVSAAEARSGFHTAISPATM
jgi:hypothetical protein